MPTARTVAASATGDSAANAGAAKMTARQRNKAASAALPPRQQVSSTLAGSAKYSFGAPKHRKGTFKIPVLDPRSAEYIPGVKNVPGAGQYEITSAISRHDKKLGHPEYRRAPGYCFGARTEPRDSVDNHPAPTRNRTTNFSHVRSDSFLDVPGPGAYLGVNESNRGGLDELPIQNRQPAYTMRLKCERVDRSGLGPGPFEYDTRKKHVVLQRNQPEYSVPRMMRKPVALTCDLSTEDHVGPGSYEHANSLVTQF